MALVLTLAPMLTFRAYQLNEASEVSVLLLSQRLWVVIGAALFLGEAATLAKTLGTSLITAGVGLVLWKSHQVKLTQGLLSALAALSLYLAYQAGRNASQIAPLSATSSLVTVALTTVFLKERGALINKLVGAAIATLGVVLIIR